MKFCPYCGERNPDKYKFCASCHEKLPDSTGTVKPDESKSSASAVPSSSYTSPYTTTAEQGKTIAPEQPNEERTAGKTLSTASTSTFGSFPGSSEVKQGLTERERTTSRNPEDDRLRKLIEEAKATNVNNMGRDDLRTSISNIISALNIPKILNKDIKPVLSPLDKEIIRTISQNMAEAEELYKGKICNYEVYLKLGNAAFFEGDMAKMRKYYKIVQDLQPKEEAVFFNLAMFAAIEGKWEEALENFEQVLKINSKNTEALKAEAIIYRSLGRTEEAIRLFDSLLAENQNSEELLTRKAAALCDLGKYEDALRLTEKTLSINSDRKSVV